MVRAHSSAKARDCWMYRLYDQCWSYSGHGFRKCSQLHGGSIYFQLYNICKMGWHFSIPCCKFYPCLIALKILCKKKRNAMLSLLVFLNLPDMMLFVIERNCLTLHAFSTLKQMSSFWKVPVLFLHKDLHTFLYSKLELSRVDLFSNLHSLFCLFSLEVLSWFKPSYHINHVVL